MTRPTNFRELGETEEVEFVVKCKMNKSCANEFLSFLATLSDNGKIGHSELIGFYSDGDGDFRPKFETNIKYNRKKPIKSRELDSINFFDAG